MLMLLRIVPTLKLRKGVLMTELEKLKAARDTYAAARDAYVVAEAAYNAAYDAYADSRAYIEAQKETEQ